MQAYRHRRIHAHHVSLFNEQLPRLVAHFAHLRLRYRTTCSKLFYVSAACQEFAHRPLIACAYLSRSLILATAPHGAAVVSSDFCSSARVRFATPYYKSVGLNCLVCFACFVVATLRRTNRTAVLSRILCRVRKLFRVDCLRDEVGVLIAQMCSRLRRRSRMKSVNSTLCDGALVLGGTDQLHLYSFAFLRVYACRFIFTNSSVHLEQFRTWFYRCSWYSFVCSTSLHLMQYAFQAATTITEIIALVLPLRCHSLLRKYCT
jgi:hypothetical protein